eukprot:jgi/Bigna1/135601/aug1.30_g10309
MIVGKEHTGKTTLYKALKGEEFCDVESTVLADVTVHDVTVEKTDEDVKGDDNRETIFKTIEHGGNHERALGLAYLKSQRPQEEKNDTSKIPCRYDKKGKPPSDVKNAKTDTETAAAVVAVEGKEHTKGSSTKKSIVDEDATESKKLHKLSGEVEETLLKELKPGLLQESLKNPEAIRVSVWDFAGQEVFYTSHVMFLNRNCLYMVVFSLEEFLGRENDAKGNEAAKQKEKAEEYLRFWLQNIRTFAPGAPIILVGTKIDKLEEYNDPEALLEVLDSIDQQITEMARKVFEGFKRFPWSRCKRWRPEKSYEPADLVFFPADSKFRSSDKKVHSTIMELRNKVMETLKNNPKANEEVPSQWTKVCDDLIATEQAIFTLESIEEICFKRGIVDKGEVRLMLQKFHDQGVAIYFDEDGLRDHIVMRPQHLVDLVKKLIFDRRLHKKLYKNQELFAQHGKLVDEFLDIGVIHDVVLKHLMLTDDGPRVAENKRLYEFSRKILQKFMILCKIGGTEKYLVPSMMQAKGESMDRKEHTVVGKFSLLFKRLRPRSYFETFSGNIVTELSSESKRTKELRGGATSPMILEEQIFGKGKAEIYLEPLRFRISTSMLERNKSGRKRHIMAINVEVLSEIGHCARILQFILKIARNVLKWPYKNNEALDFSVLLFDREMTYPVKYYKWESACMSQETKLVSERSSETASEMVEIARFRHWEQFYDLFLENSTLRSTFNE